MVTLEPHAGQVPLEVTLRAGDPATEPFTAEGGISLFTSGLTLDAFQVAQGALHEPPQIGPEITYQVPPPGADVVMHFFLQVTYDASSTYLPAMGRDDVVFAASAVGNVVTYALPGRGAIYFTSWKVGDINGVVPPAGAMFSVNSARVWSSGTAKVPTGLRTIDWGDGTPPDVMLFDSLAHTYYVPGTYSVVASAGATYVPLTYAGDLALQVDALTGVGVSQQLQVNWATTTLASGQTAGDLTFSIRYNQNYPPFAGIPHIYAPDGTRLQGTPHGIVFDSVDFSVQTVDYVVPAGSYTPGQMLTVRSRVSNNFNAADWLVPPSTGRNEAAITLGTAWRSTGRQYLGERDVFTVNAAAAAPLAPPLPRTLDLVSATRDSAVIFQDRGTRG